MTHHALVARLEGAEAGNDELSAHVLKALIAPADAWVERSRFNGAWCIYECPEKPRVWEVSGPLRNAPVTTSIDAALSLAGRVLPGMGAWDVGFAYSVAPSYYARLVVVRVGQPEEFGRAATPALALCIAILRAKGEPR